MKTILQALIDEISYPIRPGRAENKLVARGLEPDAECDATTFTDKRFIGAVADTLISLLDAVNFSEADTSISGLDVNAIQDLANRYYETIGEPDNCVGLPTVTILTNF